MTKFINPKQITHIFKLPQEEFTKIVLSDSTVICINEPEMEVVNKWHSYLMHKTKIMVAYWDEKEERMRLTHLGNWPTINP